MRSMAGLALPMLSGITVGLGSAVVWIVLDIPSRVMDIFSFESPKLAGWSLLLGAVFSSAALLAGITLAAGPPLGIAAMLLGGAMTGMLSSALAEVAEVMPRFFTGFRLTHQVKTLVLAMALGKASGAFVASFFRLW